MIIDICVVQRFVMPSSGLAQDTLYAHDARALHEQLVLQSLLWDVRVVHNVCPAQTCHERPEGSFI